MKPEEVRKIIILISGVYPEGSRHAGKPRLKEFCKRFGLSRHTVEAHLSGVINVGQHSAAFYRSIKREAALKSAIRRAKGGPENF